MSGRAEPWVSVVRHERARRAVGVGREREAPPAEEPRHEDGQQREAIAARRRPAEQAALAALGQRAHLQVMAAEEAELGALGALAREHGAREQPHGAASIAQLTVGELRDRGAEPGAQEPRLRHGGTRQRHDSLHRQPPRGEEAPHRDHVLVTHVPGGALARDRR